MLRRISSGWRNSSSLLFNQNILPLTTRQFAGALESNSIQKRHDKPNFLEDDASYNQKERWLESLLKSPEKQRLVDLEPYLIVLRSLSKESKGGTARRAEQWMKRLEEQCGIDRENAQEINSDSTRQFSKLKGRKSIDTLLEGYCCTIQGWANANGEDPVVSVKRAENWLEKAKQIAHQAAEPSQLQSLLTNCYNAYLDACSKGRGGKKHPHIVRNNAKKAELTLKEMMDQYSKLGEKSIVVPNTESLNFVLRAITRCRLDIDIAEKSINLLRQMENSLEQQTNSERLGPKKLVVHPNFKSYNMVLDAIATVAKLKASRNQRSRNHGRGQGNDDDGTYEMNLLQECIEYMRDLFDRGRLGIIENNVPFNIHLTAYANIAGTSPRHNASMQAERLFWEMEDMRENQNFPEGAPCSLSYLKVIQAWANSRDEKRGERASWWLRKQWQDWETTQDAHLMPTTSTYTAVIRAWDRAGNSVTAEAVMQEFLEKSSSLQVAQLEPNTEIFCAIVKSWTAFAERKDNGFHSRIKALKKAEEWLNYLSGLEKECGPTTTHDLFLGVLKAAKNCAHGRQDVLDLADSIFNKLRDSRYPVDHNAYSCLLQVGLLAFSAPEHDKARSDFVEKLFKECCEDGLLSKNFIRALTNGPIYRTGWTEYESSRMSGCLFPDWPLPPCWTRNIKHESVLPQARDLERTGYYISKRLQNRS